MALRINNIKLNITANDDELLKAASKALRIDSKCITKLTKVKSSIDARRKDSILLIFTVDVEVKDEEKVLKKCKNPNVSFAKMKRYSFHGSGKAQLRCRPVIIGFGPAGIFCAYRLALEGYKPLVLERGACVDDRINIVNEFWQTGKLNPSTNVQFGEGGAGTFSDGKLNTGVKDESGRIQYVLETFVTFGANEDILYKNKPHIGTDRLRGVIKAMREEIERLGGEVRFNSTVTDINIGPDNRIKGLYVNSREYIEAELCVLAIGHSARDTFYMLHDRGLHMEAKSFAVGVRAEHSQELISRAMYGDAYSKLPAADYKLSYKCEDGRGVYSFCMCPGGFVVNASSEEKELCVNGMSNSDRSEPFANSALVVTISPQDYHGENDPLAGVSFQRELEAKAYIAGEGKIPVQSYKAFEKNEADELLPHEPHTKGACKPAELRKLLPSFIGDDICEAMKHFGKIIQGYDSEDALFIGVESRTSSPVRINRSETFESLSVKGIFPCGEGAGYAGGITSAAVDGIKVYEAIAESFAPFIQTRKH